MRDGIMSGRIPMQLPYAKAIQAAADTNNESAALMYGIAQRETIRGQRAGLWIASTVVSPDGGHGLFQLTSSYPSDWQQPQSNACYAAEHFIAPARAFFVAKGLLGESLIRCIAAAFNAGLETAWAAHLDGDCDACTTGGDYGADVFTTYNAIVHNQPFR